MPLQNSFHNQITIIFVFLSILNLTYSTYLYAPKSNSAAPPKSSFKSCCALGSQNANTSSSCDDYSILSDKSSGCKSAYTICCTQNKRVGECERGKKHSLAGSPCADLKNNNVCDAVIVSGFLKKILAHLFNDLTFFK